MQRPLDKQFKIPLLVGLKTTTIRQTPWEEGASVTLYCWTGQPYRSPREPIASVLVERTTPVEIHHTAAAGIEVFRLPRMRRVLWKCEGFASRKEFAEYWARKVKPGSSATRHLMEFSVVKVLCQTAQTQFVCECGYSAEYKREAHLGHLLEVHAFTPCQSTRKMIMCLDEEFSYTNTASVVMRAADAREITCTLTTSGIRLPYHLAYTR